MGNNLVAFCDVDAKRAGDIYQKHPAARTFEDFRVMFDQMEKEIDAVLVATPDHTHAVAAVAAMKLGKHVYCEKPLTRTVHEARVMRETAAPQGGDPDGKPGVGGRPPASSGGVGVGWGDRRGAGSPCVVRRRQRPNEASGRNAGGSGRA
jgi:hypothetical protein